MKRSIFAGCSIQNGRTSNMDSLLLKEWDIEGKRCILAAICDGVGSLQNGSLAAAYSVRRLSEWFEQQLVVSDIQSRLGLEIRQINTEIVELYGGATAGTASTLSALLLCPEKYYIAHVGDSRIYLYRNGNLEQLTIDQVTELGHLKAYLGYNGEISLIENSGFLQTGSFLLCSDGLYKKMDLQLMQKVLKGAYRRNIQKSIHQLLDYAIAQGERDNISVAIILHER